MSKKPYSIGLDIGTNSVGWAVINNDDYKLVRHKHQNMWGAHLFSEAQKAKSRRIYRSSRRRIARRKKRIALLQRFFKDEMAKIDPLFFERMRESMLQAEDKNARLDQDLNILFSDDKFKDKDFYKKYPTIYHLRSDLVHSSEKRDIRLVYLALHHIIKYRGNFLVEGSTDKVATSNNSEAFDELMQILEVDDNQIKQDIKEIIQNEDLNSSRKSSDILSLISFNSDNKNRYQEMIKAIVGLKANAQKMFDDVEADPEDKDRYSFKFSESSYEEKREKIAEGLGDERFELIEKLELVYNWMIFSQFIKSNKTFSDIMVDRYDDYLKDLKGLKQLYKKYCTPDEYKKFFREIKKDYVNYAFYDDFHGKAPVEDLYKTIKKELAAKVGSDDRDWKRFERRSELGEYLKRQRIRDNGAIPRQIHQYEMEQILAHQAEFYPFLKENFDKIISIHEFRLPYYVGPLGSKSSNPHAANEFSWAVRNEGGEITPWNFHEKIDDMASAEKFIERMRNDCTYLPGEKTLAKNSLLYGEFSVRNELANIKIGGKSLSPDVKNQIYEGLFVQNNSKVSKTKLLKFLDDNQIPHLGSDVTGLSGSSFLSALRSYHDFAKIGLEPAGKNRQMIEEIIEWITIFEDKKILIKKLKLKYGNILTDAQIDKISKLNYQGWGKLSRKLLDGSGSKNDEDEDIRIVNHQGESIIERMRQTGKNFMQIAQKEDSEFKEIIDNYIKDKFDGKITYEDIENLAGSPGIKRGLWRSIRIINEVEEIMGYPPDSISLEFARDEEEKGVKTSTRKRKLEKMFKDLEDDKAHSNQIKAELKEYESQLNKKRFYLYFLQNGKCMYTGKSLDIEKLDSYEIDHIIPRSLVKDDSLDNTVLVLRTKNQEKLDEYPIDSSIRTSQAQRWRALEKAGLMSNSKLKRLTETDRNSEYLGGFIQRQIVETRQIIKHLAVLLKEQYKNSDTKVFAIRAQMSSQFRHWQDIPKSREINDFHHAKDAYLAVVLANFINEKFKDKDLTKQYLYGEYVKFGGGQSEKSTDKQMDDKKSDRQKTDDFILSLFYRTKKNIVEDVIKIMRYNDCLVTKKTEIDNGKFYDATIYSNKKNRNKYVPLNKGYPSGSIPRKKNLPGDKYGGYSATYPAYFAIISNGKTSKITSVPIYIDKQGQAAVDSYVQAKNGDDHKIVADKIGKNAKILIKDDEKIGEYYLTGAYKNKKGRMVYEVANGRQLKLPYYIEYAVSQKKVPQKLIPAADDEPKKLRWIKINNQRREKTLKGLNDFYDVFIQKLREQYPKYSKRVADNLAQGCDSYKTLEPEIQLEVAKEIMKITYAGSSNASLSKFDELKVAGDKKRVGRLKDIGIDLNQTRFVFESITGLKRRIVKGNDLKK